MILESENMPEQPAPAPVRSSDLLAELEAERTKYVAEALQAEPGSANESFWLYHIAMTDMALAMKRSHSANVRTEARRE